MRGIPEPGDETAIPVRSHAMDGSPKPVSIEIIGEEILAIVWDDGLESFLEGARLRASCPCAGCRTRRLRADGGPSAPGPGLAMAPPRLVGVDTVGRYAARLRWSDGHSAGIYEFRLLRRLGEPSAGSAGGAPPG